MRSHQMIDKRSLWLARAVAEKIDQDSGRTGLLLARENCTRWRQRDPGAAIEEWSDILRGEWEQVRSLLLDESERGDRLRQSNPFAGVLSPQERWKIYEQFSHEHPGA